MLGEVALARGEHDPGSVGRPRRLVLPRLVVGELHGVRTVGADRVEVELTLVPLVRETLDQESAPSGDHDTDVHSPPRTIGAPLPSAFTMMIVRLATPSSTVRPE